MLIAVTFEHAYGRKHGTSQAFNFSCIVLYPARRLEVSAVPLLLVQWVISPQFRGHAQHPLQHRVAHRSLSLWPNRAMQWTRRRKAGVAPLMFYVRYHLEIFP